MSAPIDYKALFGRFEQKNILVIGDVMLDAYLFGDVHRISPEAPVPVVNVKSRRNCLGGAANVALNIKAMGAMPILCSLIGDDAKGREFCEILKLEGISDAYLGFSSDRCTTTKFRIIGNKNQMLRVDEESEQDLRETEEVLLKKIIDDIFAQHRIDGIVFEDYDKGVLNPSIIKYVEHLAKQKNIPIAVDPKKRNFWEYKNVHLFKPNLKEIKDGLKIELNVLENNELCQAMESLRQKIDADAVMLTLSEYGVAIKEKDSYKHYPAQIRQIADVSGAGDTVISLAVLCLTESLPFSQIAYISNMAGGLVCEYIGVVPINKNCLLNELLSVK